MIRYKDIAIARASGDRIGLSEVSLGRVYQHVQSADVRSLTLITAWRDEYSKSENRRRNKRLVHQIRSFGGGAFKLLGQWTAPDGQTVSEESYGVVGLVKKQSVRLMRQYDQDAIVYLGPETNGEAILIFNDGSEQRIGRFSPGKIAQSYSRIKTGTFTFEGFDTPPTSMIHGYIDKIILSLYSS